MWDEVVTTCESQEATPEVSAGSSQPEHMSIDSCDEARAVCSENVMMTAKDASTR